MESEGKEGRKEGKKEERKEGRKQTTKITKGRRWRAYRRRDNSSKRVTNFWSEIIFSRTTRTI